MGTNLLYRKFSLRLNPDVINKTLSWRTLLASLITPSISPYPHFRQVRSITPILALRARHNRRALSYPCPILWSVPHLFPIHTKYLHQTSPQTHTILRIRHLSSLPPSFSMLYLLLVSSLSIVYLWPFIVTTLSHRSSFATIPPPYAFSILRLHPHALRTFSYAPPYLHLIPDLLITVYKSYVLHLCTSVHISTKSPILLLKVPLCVSVHLRTSAPPSPWNQGQWPRQGHDTQVYAKSLLSPHSRISVRPPVHLCDSPLFLYRFLCWTWAWRTRTWQNLTCLVWTGKD